jgi:hypothetical protein
MKYFTIKYYIAIGLIRTMKVVALNYNDAKKEFYNQTLINTIITVK